MARGGLSYEGIGAQQASFLAGDGIKALVNADPKKSRDSVVGVPVVIIDNNVVDLGTDGDVPFGVIDIYETDGYCGVQFRGFREDVKVVDAGATPGRVCLIDGLGALKDSADGVGVKQIMSKTVTTAATTAGTATVTITAPGSVALKTGKAIEVTLTKGTKDENAGEIRDALSADADIAAYFVVGGAAAAITLTRKVAAANETEVFDFALGIAEGAVMSATVDTDGKADKKVGLPIFVNVDDGGTATIFLG